MSEYTVKKLRELRKEWMQEWRNNPKNRNLSLLYAMQVTLEVESFLTWLSSRESKRQKGDVSRSFGSKGQETE